MKNTKHTPGEWEVLSDLKGLSIYSGAKSIATTCLISLKDSEEQKANASLIAAAPDLLTALKMAKACMKEVAPEAWEQSSAKSIIEDAIQKATA